MTQPISATPQVYRSPTLAEVEGSPAMDYNDERSQFNLWESDDGFGFMDLLDVINPLQHIPIISTLYRSLTHDEIGIGPRLAGGMLFNGPLGVILAGASAVFEEATGGDVGDNLATLIEEFENGAAPETQIVTAGDLEGLNYSGNETFSDFSLVASVEPAAGPVDHAAAAPVAAPAAAPIIARVATGIETGPDGADARIRQRIAEAQRAQAGLLLASLKAGDAQFSTPRTAEPAERRDTAAVEDISAAADPTPTVPSAPHGNHAAYGGQPDWFAAAMERALTKYKHSQALSQSPTPR